MPPARRTARPQRPAISAKCEAGQHGSCVGTVYVYPARGGKTTVRCECPTCHHGR